MEQLKRPRRDVPLGTIAKEPMAEVVPTTASASMSPEA